MAITAIKIVLRGSKAFPDKVYSRDFVEPLYITSEHGFSSVGAEAGLGSTAVINLFRSSISDCTQEGAYDLFEKELNNAFAMIAEWLGRQPENAFRHFQDVGIRVTLLVNLWIDNDQLDLEFPPSLLLICGKSNINIVVISNE
jgi:hypothetical protein